MKCINSIGRSQDITTYSFSWMNLNKKYETVFYDNIEETYDRRIIPVEKQLNKLSYYSSCELPFHQIYTSSNRYTLSTLSSRVEKLGELMRVGRMSI